jgi:hypothetical protein
LPRSYLLVSTNWFSCIFLRRMPQSEPPMFVVITLAKVKLLLTFFHLDKMWNEATCCHMSDTQISFHCFRFEVTACFENAKGRLCKRIYKVQCQFNVYEGQFYLSMMQHRKFQNKVLLYYAVDYFIRWFVGCLRCIAGCYFYSQENCLIDMISF